MKERTRRGESERERGEGKEGKRKQRSCLQGDGSCDMGRYLRVWKQRETVTRGER